MFQLELGLSNVIQIQNLASAQTLLSIKTVDLYSNHPYLVMKGHFLERVVTS